MKRFGVHRRARYLGGGLTILAFVAITLFVVLPALASTQGTLVPPPSSPGGITPTDVPIGGNGVCSNLYSTSSYNHPMPAGVSEYDNVNPINGTNLPSGNSDGVTFTLTNSGNNNAQLLQVNGTNAQILGIAVNGGSDTAVYDYRTTTQGWIAGDGNLHAPASKVNGAGTPTQWYGISHLTVCYTPTGSISGTAFTDSNGDGIQAGGTETGLSGLAVTVTNSGGTTVGTGTTNSTGGYSVPVPLGGPYAVCIHQPTNTKETVPTSSTTGSTTCTATGQAQYGYTANVASGGVSGLNFGFQTVASITVNAFFDNNGNGSNDTGDGAASTGVQLFDGSGNAIGSQQTTTGGTTTFSGLPVGQTYKVCAVTPSGGSYIETVPTSNTTNEASCPSGYAGVGYSFTLTTDGQTVPFGFEPVGSLSGTVYQDDDGPKGVGADGEFESTLDTPLGFWTVTLYDQSGHEVGLPAMTDGNGSYSIAAVFDPGKTYTVCVTPPSGTEHLGQSEPRPTSSDNCTPLDGTALQKGQTFTPTSGNASVTENFGVAPSVEESSCPPPTPFGFDNTGTGGSELQIQLAKCKENQTFVFDSGTLTDGVTPFVSVWASDQTQTLVPLIEHIVFPDPLGTDGAPKYTGISYTDTFPYDPDAAAPMASCARDPRVAGPNGADPDALMTLPSGFTDDDLQALMPATNVDGSGPATSCVISVKTYVDASGNHWLEAYAATDIDGFTKPH